MIICRSTLLPPYAMTTDYGLKDQILLSSVNPSFRSPYNDQTDDGVKYPYTFAVQDVQLRNVSMLCCERQRNNSFRVIATISLTNPNVAKSWKQVKF